MKRTTISFELHFNKLDEHHEQLAKCQQTLNSYVNSFYKEVNLTIATRYKTCSAKNKNYLDKTKLFLEKEYPHVIKPNIQK